MRMIGIGGWLVVSVCLGTTLAFDGETFHNDPTSKYERCQIEGFSILVNPRLHEHPKDGGAAMDELNRQLGNVVRVVPPGPLARLRKIAIWVEWQETPGLGEFHADIDELNNHNRNRQKYHCVEIVNARHLVEWAHIQPWAMMHELAHAYHFVVLGRDNAAVDQAYTAAMQSHIYDQSTYVLNVRKPAFAKKNRYEYFAEISESYFGKNDFSPFNRTELARFDPAGYQVLREVWGEPVAEPGP